MTVPLDSEMLRTLRARLGGAVTAPGDAGYDAARAVWNGRFDRRPAAIARCAGAADVAVALEVARARDLPVAVRSGGHDYAGNSVCAGGLVVDLSELAAVEIDAATKRARVGPGATWGRFDGAAQTHGLATTGGTVSTVGVAGYTLGGGTGWLARRFGLGLDNLIAAEVVLASGVRLRASDAENPDLFWALRGGGGNFGVVTSFEYRLHAVGPDVLGGQLVHPLEAADAALRFVRDFMAEAPDELQCYPFFYRVPPIEPFPAPLHGRPAIALVAAWSGALEAGERALAPLREFGTPALDTVRRLTYVDLQRSFDAGMPKGLRWYSRAHYFDALPDAAIGVVVRHVESLPGAYGVVYFEPQGGAIARVDPAATAFPHRRAAYGLHIFPGWAEPAEDDANLEWARAFDRAISPYANGGVYVNLLDADEPERVPAAYGDNYRRLTELKRRYDPGNLFRVNQNVPPAGALDPGGGR
jgi:FAD/FMN-containing dehydrogenase